MNNSEKHEEQEVSKLTLALIVVAVGTVIAGLMYLFLWKDNEETMDKPEGNTVDLSEEEQEVLASLAVVTVEQAGDFGLIEEDFTSETAMTIRANITPDSPMFTEFFVTRANRLELMKEEGLIYPGGRADLNSSRWVETDEPTAYASFSATNIVPEVPTYAVKGDTMTVVDIPVTYTTVITTRLFSITEAPPEGVEVPKEFYTSIGKIADQKAVMRFAQVGGNWQLYEFKTIENPVGLVFWTNPDLTTAMGKVKVWEKGETIVAD